MKELPLIDRRRIEAGVLVPLIRAFEKEVGVERAREVVREVIERLAREQGERLRAESADASPIERVKDLIPAFSKGDALEIEVVEDSDGAYGFDVTRCAFAELYREMGAPELGVLLSCSRDFALAEGLGEGLELRRSGTILEGASRCDFRFRARSQARDEPDAR